MMTEVQTSPATSWKSVTPVIICDKSVGSVPRGVTKLEAEGLVEGNQFVFRVAAENVVGPSANIYH